MVLKVYTGPGAMRRINRRYANNKKTARVYRKPRTSSSFARAVRNVISPELKFQSFSVEKVPIPFNSNDQINRISNIAQGDSQSQRTGNWIQPRSIYGSIICEGNTAEAAQTQQVRVGIVCWMEDFHPQLVDIPPTLLDLMQETSSPIGPYRYTNTGKFKIITSKVYILSTQPGNPQHQKKFTFKVDLSNMDKITYQDANGKLNQYFIFGTSADDEAENPPTMQYHVSMRFNDS